MKINPINLLIINSPWPIILRINIIIIITNLVINIRNKFLTSIVITSVINIMISSIWLNNTNIEKIIIGITRNYNEISIKTIIYFIIITESIFFITFFYVIFSLSYFNNFIYNFKFNLNIFKLNFILSFTNLIILLSSRITLIISTYLNEKINNKSLFYLKSTIWIGLYFVIIQSIEYYILNFNISNSIFFSNFFILTIFHITHVIIGSIIIIYIINNKKKILFSNKIKLKIICWYWHFVDLIWVIIFVTIYTK